jgi:UDP-N-acetylglucosamine 2-epimerase (non-hydrolysing)
MSSRVLVIFGTRPEGIKMMPVVRALRASRKLKQTICVTGQHREMLDQVFTAFGEKPDLDLDIMAPDQTLGDITAAVLRRIGEVLVEHKPDLVLVHGDTTTAMAAAMAAFYAQVPIGHVEAGLRSFDLLRPWPEEFNRVTIDSLAALMFAPTEGAAANLRREYNRKGKTSVTGNTGIDALLYIAARTRSEASLRAAIAARYSFLDDDRKLILVTGHRRESFGDGFERVCDGLASIAGRPDVQLIYPVHLNPHVQGTVQQRLRSHPNIHLIPPIDYLDMVYLMQRATLLITDSGGIQEEGPALGKPVLLMREVTERPEAVALGAVKLVGTDSALMRKEVDMLLDDGKEYARRAVPVFPYGDGNAAQRIVAAIEEFFGE